jgi:drug/metabolite transporter (DMT)-like permease
VARNKGGEMDLRAVLMGLAFVIMWSSAFTSARMIVADAPPLTALALRFCFSGLIGVAVARLLGQNWHLTRSQWRATAVFGICQNALYLGLNFIAMQTIEASLAAIIASTMPLLVAVAGWVIFREKMQPLGLAGLVAGVVGVCVIMGARFQGGVDVLGVMLCLIGVISLTIATLAMRGAAAGGNLIMVVGLQMLVGSAALAVPALLFEPFEVNWTPRLFAAFTYTTLVPGLAATLVWFMLVERIGTVKAATFHFLNPFFGVAVASVLLSETIGFLDIVGVLVITAGILAVQLSKQTPR